MTRADTHRGDGGHEKLPEGRQILLSTNKSRLAQPLRGRIRREPLCTCPNRADAEALIWPFTEIPGRDADRNPTVRRMSTARLRRGST
jgi:hypothetical protein